MVGTCGDGIEREVELILPPEVEPRLAERIIPGSSLDYTRPNRLNMSRDMMHRFSQSTGQSLLYPNITPGLQNPVYPRP